MSSELSFAEELGGVLGWAAALLLLLSAVVLAFELRRHLRHRALVALTALLAWLTLAGVVLRPSRVTTRGSVLGPQVVVLVDRSRRMLLRDGEQTRDEGARRAVAALRERYASARLNVLGFDEGAPRPWTEQPSPRRAGSDALGALEGVASLTTGRPDLIVLVSDGRLTRPAPSPRLEELRAQLGALGIQGHTVATTRVTPKDASVRAVRAAGAAVAHQPLQLVVEVGCAGGLDCDALPVTVRELRAAGPPEVLATGVATLEDGVGRVELSVTLERAGARVLEVALRAPGGDEIPDNDARLLTFSVARERVRLLHVAGRPTYDVRALRRWLKTDDSVDLVAFFILRTEEDDTATDDDSELALIPFPVDELFTQHLPSFDAVVLQDIDAVRYKLSQYLPALARYVSSGGGLILVGGPAAFAGGGYAGSGLDEVLPVHIPTGGASFDVNGFLPTLTDAGRSAPVLSALRELAKEGLPVLPGANLLGGPRPGAIVLWEHPRLRAGEQPMPVLALSEAGDGRSIALGVDGTHLLGFSEWAAESGGRAFGALWDGLLGWLMRDPRFEPARIELESECIAGEPTRLRVTRLAQQRGPLKLVLERLGAEPAPRTFEQPTEEGSVVVDVGALEAGGYTARASIGEAPAARVDFACERGGEAWSDSRPDPERLGQLARALGGVAVGLGGIGELPLPPATTVAAERHVTPWAPAWAWATAAAVLAGLHWLARRRAGLA